MNTPISIILVILFSAVHVIGSEQTIDPMVADQFKNDINTFINSSSNSITQESAENIDSLYNEAVSTIPTAFQFSESDLTALKSTETLYSRSQIEATYRILDERLGGKPKPAMVQFYYEKFSKKLLNPVQQAIFYKFLLQILPVEKAE